ncbi:fec operon regulator FecR [compost metagenome]
MTEQRKLAESAIAEAIDWQLRLQMATPSPELLAEFHAWRQANEEHAEAWRRLCEIDAPFAGLDRAGSQVLLHSYRPRKARPGMALALLLALGCGLFAVNRQIPLEALGADYATATGELRSVRLEDGTELVLGPRTLLDVDFDSQQRTLTLRHGSLAVRTAHGDSRRFVVRSEDGQMRPLGTYFSVLRDDSGTTLDVLRSAVAARGTAPAEVTIKEGQRLQLHDGQLLPVSASPSAADAWTRGMLLVRERPLGEVVAALADYKRGFISVDPSLAGLTVSGSFSLRDGDRTLAALANALPIRIERYGALWTRIVPRENAPQGGAEK